MFSIPPLDLTEIDEHQNTTLFRSVSVSIKIEKGSQREKEIEIGEHTKTGIKRYELTRTNRP